MRTRFRRQSDLAPCRSWGRQRAPRSPRVTGATPTPDRTSNRARAETPRPARSFTGVVQAPITGIVLVIEMTADFTTFITDARSLLCSDGGGQLTAYRADLR